MPDINNKKPSEKGEEQEHMEDKENMPEENQETVTAEKEIQGDIEKLQKQLSEAESLVKSYKDRLLRLAAEFENFKKRVEIDRADFIKFSNEKIIRDLIPILGDFERALAISTQNSDNESFRKGIELIYQKLFKLLEDNGLKPIESIGKEFDVMYHDVLMQVPRQGVKSDTIVEEVERGYTLHGKVIKHAKVIVASPAQDNSHREERKN
jgi:molecular chaperone GrpE